jgi:hypothetical protein
MKDKDQTRIERKRRLAQALKANLARRKAQRRRQQTNRGPGEAGSERETSQEGCPGDAVVLGTGHTGG